jgi:hypothetical protein
MNKRVRFEKTPSEDVLDKHMRNITKMQLDMEIDVARGRKLLDYLVALSVKPAVENNVTELLLTWEQADEHEIVFETLTDPLLKIMAGEQSKFVLWFRELTNRVTHANRYEETVWSENEAWPVLLLILRHISLTTRISQAIVTLYQYGCKPKKIDERRLDQLAHLFYESMSDDPIVGTE